MSFSFAVMICCILFLVRGTGRFPIPLLFPDDTLQSYSYPALFFRQDACVLRPFLVLFLALRENRTAHITQEEAQDISGTVEGHPIKAVAAFAIFIQHAPDRIERVHVASN